MIKIIYVGDFMLNNVIGYVRKDGRKYEKTKESFGKIFRKIFCKVKIEYIREDVLFLIPNYKKYGKIMLKKISRQIKKYAKQNEIKELIFEENLDFIKEKFNEYYISKGKMIMKNNVLNIFQYIFRINKSNINLENAYILVNEYNKQNTYIINELVENFKTVNIITENIRKYRKLENYWYEEGVLITVSNNKRKSLKNAKYIVNIDFDKNKIMMYNINLSSIIINVSDEDIVLKSNFNGVLINNIELQIDKNKEDFVNEFYGNINKKIFLEAIIKKNIKKLEYIKKINQEYGVKIEELTGVRGKLENNEFLV